MKKFFVFIFIVAILATGGFFGYKYFEKEKEIIDETDFIVTASHTDVLSESNDLTFAYGVEYYFTANKGYSLEILPNSDIDESNFFFYVDDKPYYFRAETKLLDAFVVYTFPNNTFCIKAKAGDDLLTMLKKMYPDNVVRFKDGEDFSNLEANIFSLVIREKNGDDKVVVNFGLASMTIDLPSEIVF